MATSSFVGVHFHRTQKKWRAQIRVLGKMTHLGYFDTQEVAARKFDEIAGPLGRPVNFPRDGEGVAVKKSVAGGGDSALAAAGLPQSPENYPKAVGVAWHAKTKRWRAQRKVDGVVKHLGMFESHEEAVRSFDRAAGMVARSPGPTHGLEVGGGGGGRADHAQEPVEEPNPAGVEWNAEAQKWRAWIEFDGEKKPLGHFKSAAEANRRYSGMATVLEKLAEIKAQRAVKAAEEAPASRPEDTAPHQRRTKLEPGPSSAPPAPQPSTPPVMAPPPKSTNTPVRRRTTRRGPDCDDLTPVSQFVGVFYYATGKAGNKWRAQITGLDGKKKFLGAFESEEAAARKFDEAAGPLGRPVNFPGEGQDRAAKRDFPSSRYLGVSFDARSSQWMASVTLNGETFVGYVESRSIALQSSLVLNSWRAASKDNILHTLRPKKRKH